MKWILPTQWGKFYSSFNNILNGLGKQRNEMLAVHLVKTYFCIPMLLYTVVKIRDPWMLRGIIPSIKYSMPADGKV